MHRAVPMMNNGLVKSLKNPNTIPVGSLVGILLGILIRIPGNRKESYGILATILAIRVIIACYIHYSDYSYLGFYVIPKTLSSIPCNF